MAFALTESSFREIRDTRVTVMVFADDVRIFTRSGLNFRAALEMVMAQNSIGRQALVIPEGAPTSVHLTKDLGAALEAVKALGRLDRLKFN